MRGINLERERGEGEIGKKVNLLERGKSTGKSGKRGKIQEERTKIGKDLSHVPLN